MGSALFTKWSSAEDNGNCQGHYEERKRALCGTENVCHTRLYILIFSWDFRGCQTLPFLRGQTMPKFPKNRRLSQGKTKYSLRGKVSHRHSHNIPIKPYTSPLSFQLQLLIGRGHFSTNFLPIILHKNPSIFPASPFLFISLFSSPSSHLTSSATRNYEIQREPLQLLLCSHFLLPTVKLGIGK